MNRIQMAIHFASKYLKIADGKEARNWKIVNEKAPDGQRKITWKLQNKLNE